MTDEQMDATLHALGYDHWVDMGGGLRIILVNGSPRLVNCNDEAEQSDGTSDE